MKSKLYPIKKSAKINYKYFSSSYYKKNNTKKSVFNTIVFDDNNIINHNIKSSFNTSIEIYDERIEKAITKYYHLEKTSVLSFANFTNPGGGYMKGCISQEGSLCHVTNLYNILKEFNGTYYQFNKKIYVFKKLEILANKNKEKIIRNKFLKREVKKALKPLGCNRGLFIPNVAIHPNLGRYTAYEKNINVISVAAPNIKIINEYHHDELLKERMLNKNNEILKKRIEFIFDIAYSMKQKNLILGAFGCGISGQDPINVAKCFSVLLRGKYKNVFDRVIFSIPYSPLDKNLESFIYVFEQDGLISKKEQKKVLALEMKK